MVLTAESHATPMGAYLCTRIRVRAGMVVVGVPVVGLSVRTLMLSLAR